MEHGHARYGVLRVCWKLAWPTAYKLERLDDVAHKQIYAVVSRQRLPRLVQLRNISLRDKRVRVIHFRRLELELFLQQCQDTMDTGCQLLQWS